MPSIPHPLGKIVSTGFLQTWKMIKVVAHEIYGMSSPTEVWVHVFFCVKKLLHFFPTAFDSIIPSNNPPTMALTWNRLPLLELQESIEKIDSMQITSIFLFFLFGVVVVVVVIGCWFYTLLVNCYLLWLCGWFLFVVITHTTSTTMLVIFNTTRDVQKWLFSMKVRGVMVIQIQIFFTKWHMLSTITLPESYQMVARW